MTKKKIETAEITENVNTAAIATMTAADEEMEAHNAEVKAASEIKEESASVDTAADETSEKEIDKIIAEKLAKIDAIIEKLKGGKTGRWIKVHSKYKEIPRADNVMDISVNDGGIMAELKLTANTRNFEKAAWWMLRYLNNAGAAEIVEEISEKVNGEISKTTKETEGKIAIAADNWTAEIEKISKGIFNTRLEYKVA